MKLFAYQYKCRRCGEVITGAIGGLDPIKVLVGAILNRDFFPESGIKVTMTYIHAGCGGGYGIADLIGCAEEPQ